MEIERKKNKNPVLCFIHIKLNAEVVDGSEVSSGSVSFYLRDPNSGSPRAKHLVAVEREAVAVEYLGL